MQADAQKSNLLARLALLLPLSRVLRARFRGKARYTLTLGLTQFSAPLLPNSFVRSVCFLFPASPIIVFADNDRHLEKQACLIKVFLKGLQAIEAVKQPCGTGCAVFRRSRGV